MEEKVLYKAGANLYGFANSQGGNLILTNQKLIFQGTLISSKTRIEINLKDISNCTVKTVSSGLLAAIVPMKVVEVTLTNGEVHKFRVTKQDEWVNQIMNAKLQLQ